MQFLQAVKKEHFAKGLSFHVKNLTVLASERFHMKVDLEANIWMKFHEIQGFMC